MKTKSLACAALALLVTTWPLTGCGTACFGRRDSSALSLVQPRVLRLPAGQAVQTADGVYTPAASETWHSAAAFADLEAKLLDAAAALAQERNRKP